MAKRIRVMIVDDQRVFAEAVALALSLEADIEMCGSPVLHGEDAADAARERCPDVVLVDLRLAGIDGIETTRRIKAARPQASVVIVTAGPSSESAAAAAGAGASGYQAKSLALKDVVAAVRAAASGNAVVAQPPRGDGTESSGRFAELLTPREIEILSLLASGLQSRDIARRLFLSPRTIDTHVHNVLTKLGVRSKLEAVVAGLRSGVVRLDAETGSAGGE